MREGMTSLNQNVTIAISIIIIWGNVAILLILKRRQTLLVEEVEELEEPILLPSLKENDEEEMSLWYLENGASNHIYGGKSKFVELDKKVGNNVTFKGSSKIQI